MPLTRTDKKVLLASGVSAFTLAGLAIALIRSSAHGPPPPPPPPPPQTCSPPSCFCCNNDADCSTLGCYPFCSSSQICVECRTNSDCTGGNICQNGVCVCGTKPSNPQCGGYCGCGMEWDATQCKCVACTPRAITPLTSDTFYASFGFYKGCISQNLTTYIIGVSTNPSTLGQECIGCGCWGYQIGVVQANPVTSFNCGNLGPSEEPLCPTTWGPFSFKVGTVVDVAGYPVCGLPVSVSLPQTVFIPTTDINGVTFVASLESNKVTTDMNGDIWVNLSVGVTQPTSDPGCCPILACGPNEFAWQFICGVEMTVQGLQPVEGQIPLYIYLCFNCNCFG